MTKTLTTLNAAAALAVLAAPAAAQDINVIVDGDLVAFAGQRPVQRFGTVLVPLRGVFEKLGASVQFDGASKSILAVRGATTVSLQLGQARALVNGAERALSVPAQAVNGTTLVPLRFVSEALGARVRWQAASRTVIVSTAGGGAAAAEAPGNAGAEERPQRPAAGGPVEVTSLAHSGSADGPLRGGEVLTVTLRGTPGAAGTFTIPGVEAARSVPLRETAPGTYTGAFTVPNGVSVKGASLLASLKAGAASSPVIQAGDPVTIDAVGPRFGDLSPAAGAAVPPGKPLIYGTYSDAGTGVSAEGTRLVVNGKDVTAEATVTEAFFSYRPAADLPGGRNTLAVVARDAAGNQSRKEWAFTVAAGGGETAGLIRGLSVSPANQTLEPGDVLTVRLAAQPRGRARFSLGGAVTDRPMREATPGVYVGTYTVRKGDSLAGGPATVTVTNPAGGPVTRSAEEPLTIAAGAPERPVIESPKAGAAAGDAVTVSGRAAPGATVRYSLRYQGVLLILPAGGAVAEGEVKADARGRWSTPEIRLSRPPGVSRLTYTVEAAAVGAAGEQSEVASVEFRR